MLNREALLQEATGIDHVASVARDDAEAAERTRQAHLVAPFAPDGRCLAEERQRALPVACEVAQDPELVQHLPPQLGIGFRVGSERALEPALAFADLGAHVPEPTESSAEA
jgi:hypothetical protein